MKNLILSIAIIFAFSCGATAQVYNDATLAKVREQDRASRDVSGVLQTLSAEEHNYRADVYSTNRYFKEAREHWQKVLDNYPNDSLLKPKALFGIARSYMWERQYDKAVAYFDMLTKDYLNTKEGREGLAFKGASYVRMSKHNEAAKTYELYTTMFPTGEKIESSYLNIIDALREAKRYDEANAWVEKARARFLGMPTEINALHARLRMEIHRGEWNKAVLAADALRDLGNFRGSMTSLDEVNYLKAVALEKAGRKSEAIAVYSTVPDTLTSYYGGLATEKLKTLSPSTPRITKTGSVSSSLVKDFPAPYRTELLRYARPRGIDPRFMLAIMKQESSFRANAKSPAAARGLLQLVFDTALKYNKQAGFPNLQAEDLYRPDVNIAIASQYIDDLLEQFDNLYEAVAASYNGGEDNAARWLARSKPKEPGIFSAEVGFAESKNYVYKVMNNYRIYRELYTEDLQRR
jgi:soluble lytic murein transglycosylase